MAHAEIAFLDAIFADAMARLGPFEPQPTLTAAVSGGADSMALALLAQTWVHQRQGTLHALVVDHGLRPDSATEAEVTVGRLGLQGITATLLSLTNLQRGSALAERARIMRYEALSAACRTRGSLHLLTGHHAADQTETMMIRALGQSLTHGLAAMPGLTESAGIRLLRPLLTIEPEALRRQLQARGVAWVEDPSNHDLTALRPRLRHQIAAHRSSGETTAMIRAANTIGVARAAEEIATAAELAGRAIIRPQGFAFLSPGRIGVAALATLIRTISGAAYAPSLSQISDLAAQPRPATLAGVRILWSGRAGERLMLVREEAAIEAPIESSHGAVWDGRFRVLADGTPHTGVFVGKLGSDAAHFRRLSSLPSVILRTLPAVRVGETLAAVPHLGYVVDKSAARTMALFSPRRPLAGACFVPGSPV